MPEISRMALASALLLPYLHPYILCGAQGSIQPEAAPKLEFEAASIKPSAHVQLPAGGDALAAAKAAMSLVYRSGNTIYGRNATLEDLIGFAYNPLPWTNILGGPPWMRSARYEVVAKPGRSASLDELRAMLKNLLADRFGLVAHLEDRNTSVYLLEVAKGGSKLQETAGPLGSVAPAGIFKYRGKSGSMQQLAFFLAIWVVHRPVLDRTGLKGFYNFTLEWSPMDLTAPTDVAGEAPASGRATDDTNPSIFRAVQEQFGLRLRAANVPVPTVVVDRAEKPSGN